MAEAGALAARDFALFIRRSADMLDIRFWEARE
jgi:hypothetical protein